MSMKPTESVFEIDGASQRRVVHDVIERDHMKIIVVKGIGYVVVSRNMENPELFRRMGEVTAKTFEENS